MLRVNNSLSGCVAALLLGFGTHYHSLGRNPRSVELSLKVAVNFRVKREAIVHCRHFVLLEASLMAYQQHLHTLYTVLSRQ